MLKQNFPARFARTVVRLPLRSPLRLPLRLRYAYVTPTVTLCVYPAILRGELLARGISTLHGLPSMSQSVEELEQSVL